MSDTILGRGSMYESDNPITNPEKDYLGRRKFAENLANSMLMYNSSEPLCIGLMGGWGSGKTSLINMTENAIEARIKDEKDKPIIMRFEPWNFSTTDQIISQFFTMLELEFQSEDRETLNLIGKAFKKYGEIFSALNAIPVVGGFLAPLAKTLGKAVGEGFDQGLENKSLAEQKEIIEDLLLDEEGESKLPKQVIIVIDDIDRLPDEQIRLIFRLVTSVAHFSRFMYLLAFDKDVVVKALEKVQGGDGEAYLEKIVQIPIAIPELSKGKKYEILLDKLDGLRRAYPQFYDAEHWWDIFDDCIAPFVGNLRDINRLYNLVSFKLLSVKGDIDFADLVSLTLIELREPALYQWISRNKGELAKGYFDSFKNVKSTKKRRELIKDELSQILKNTDANTALRCLGTLFPYFGTNVGIEIFSFSANDNLLMRIPNFNRYFKLSITDNMLDEQLVNDMLHNYPLHEIEEKLFLFKRQGLSWEFTYELRKCFADLDEDRRLVFIRAMIDTDLMNYEIVEFVRKVDSEWLADLLSDMLKHANLRQLNNIAQLIYQTEHAYGRHGCVKNENYSKLLPVERLETLEKQFTDSVKANVSTYVLLTNAYYHTFNLMDRLDGNWLKECLTEYLKKDYENKLKLLVQFYGNDRYKKYISEEEMLAAVQRSIENKSILDMSERVQCCAAYFLLRQEPDNADKSSWKLQEKIDAKIVSWEES